MNKFYTMNNWKRKQDLIIHRYFPVNGQFNFPLGLYFNSSLIQISI